MCTLKSVDENEEEVETMGHMQDYNRQFQRTTLLLVHPLMTYLADD